MTKFLQIGVLIILAVVTVKAASTHSERPRTTRPTTRPTTARMTRRTTTRTTAKRKTITDAIITPTSYEMYHMNSPHDCGREVTMSIYDVIVVKAWRDGSHIKPRTNCKITFILNSSDYHLKVNYDHNYSNYINSTGVTLNVGGGLNNHVMMLLDQSTHYVSDRSEYQRIEMNLENDHLHKNYDFSIIVSAKHDYIALWWLGLLIPTIFIVIVSSCIGFCLRRRQTCSYRRLGSPVTVATAYPAGYSYYPNHTTLNSTHQPPRASTNQPSYGINQPLTTQPATGYGATS